MAGQHTPGPLAFEDPLGPEILSIVVGKEPYDWRHVAQISADWDEIPKAQAKRNARLIAAAPDLLEALRAVVRVADRKTAEFDLARAAIAKALGEEA